ncbi:SIMPL domain-containing protein [Muriicola sp. Z0-33]|uniref:SIMPL domain-containing protein n=1 Tax=Muriicola sp. Z0-33 TaxID=2816957 RepID=UPI002237C71C|nr:SIMPL domain-containing protein [Muriicola sp. Z0-33]MCW5517387.1 SIMPL domain-containing protein [Muriicola sp. Z0-33]
MNNIGWLKIAIICLAIVIAGFFVGNMHKTGKKYDRYVTVKGLSEREVKADLAVWPINITLTGNNLGVLKESIETQSSAVYDFFISQGFDQNDLTRGSTNISDARANLYNSGQRNVEFRYLAKSEFTVRTNDIERLQKALSASLELISKGILIGSKNTWRPIEYIFTGLNELKPSMIEEATKNAREVAEKFAKDSNAEVGNIRIARQGLFSINDRDENTPEIKIVRVVSTIDFQLED